MSDKDLGPAGHNRVKSVSRNLFKDTLTRALLADDSKKLRALSDKLLDLALSPNLTPMEFFAAYKLIAERIDGRPKEQIEGAEDNKPATGLFKIVKVEA